MINSVSVKDYLANYDCIISFNKNSDHIRYLNYYRKISKISSLRTTFFFRKNILLTTIGVKEFLVGLIAKALGGQVTQIIHDYQPHPGKKAIFVNLYNKLAAIFFKLCFHSRSQANIYGKPCDIFPLPITNFNFRTSLESQSYYVAFGRLESYKNFSYIEYLASKFPEKQFMICSKDFKPSQFLSNLSVIDTYLSNKRLCEIIQKSCAVILPYSSATQSGVVVLAYELGVPVLVSDEPGLIEYITPETGSFFSLKKSNSFLEASRKLEEISQKSLVNRINSWNEKFIL